MVKSAYVIPVLLQMAALAGCGERSASSRPATATVRISAAASLADCLEKLRQPVHDQLGLDMVINAAGSGPLAQQIAGGAPCDLFLSASPQWVDALAAKGLLVPDQRRDFLSARLVVVARREASSKPLKLQDLAEGRFWPLALGDPRTVPAGQYAQQALTAAGIWDQLHGHVAEAPDVRAALSFVASGQCPAGIVYAPDARSDKSLAVALEIDPALHQKVVYVGAVIRGIRGIRGGNEDAGGRVLDFLAGPEARKVFSDAGFIPLVP